MTILLTGACGFAGCEIARGLRAHRASWKIVGLDNLSRAGSEANRAGLQKLGVKVVHGDVRLASDIDAIGPVDAVIDAAANPSVLAGLDGQASTRQVVEHNLLGTVNLLEYCRRHRAAFVLLSTSRLYSIPALCALPVEARGEPPAFGLVPGATLPPGVSGAGLDETFSTAAPISLYGATKLASEALALEYAHSFGLPVWLNRCGVLAGAGQFGRPDQGIVAYWIHGWRERRPLRYIGFNGSGAQVRDALHPRDLVPLLIKQLECRDPAAKPRILTVGGGASNAFSLAGLSAWCADRFGWNLEVLPDRQPRPLDVPWVVMDAALAQRTWDWAPATRLHDIFDEVAAFALARSDWLAVTGGA
ncbi:MAG: NAD-dependent epimerase/dehydratase family protein [Verrucomicrobia bacterium]|nr:NAD-dependent epimerase/dehydratase family protein [Verrucomicrobiota bacterium]